MTKRAKATLIRLCLLLLALIPACSPTVVIPVTQTASARVTVSSSPSPTLSVVPSATPVTCRISTGVPAGNLNLREGKGMSYALVRVLDEGEKMTVITKGSWLEVKDAHGNHGYINQKYCK